MKEAFSLARKSTALATSSARPKRPIGCEFHDLYYSLVNEIINEMMINRLAYQCKLLIYKEYCKYCSFVI